MTTKQKFISGIILGVAAGVAVILLTQTKRGNDILSDIEDAADDVADNVKDKLAFVEKQYSDLIKKSKNFINDIEDKAKDLAKAIKD